MSDHLTPDQFAKCFVNGAEGLELQHITECPRCSDELDRFGSAVASFRSAVRDRIDVHVGSDVPEVSSFPLSVQRFGLRSFAGYWPRRQL